MQNPRKLRVGVILLFLLSGSLYCAGQEDSDATADPVPYTQSPGYAEWQRAVQLAAGGHVVEAEKSLLRAIELDPQLHRRVATSVRSTFSWVATRRLWGTINWSPNSIRAVPKRCGSWVLLSTGQGSGRLPSMPCEKLCNSRQDRAF